jgi:hypothetical protein
MQPKQKQKYFSMNMRNIKAFKKEHSSRLSIPYFSLIRISQNLFKTYI